MDFNLVILATTFLSTFFVAIDWLIGHENRQAIKDKVGWWFLLLEDKTWLGLVSTDARFLSRVLGILFGKKIVTIMFPIRVFLFWLLIIITIIYIQTFGGIETTRYEAFTAVTFVEEFSTDFSPDILFIEARLIETDYFGGLTRGWLFIKLIPTFPCVLVSLGLTYFFFNLMSTTVRSVKYLCALITIDVIVSITLASLSLIASVSSDEGAVFDLIEEELLGTGIKNIDLLVIKIKTFILLGEDHLSTLLIVSSYIGCIFSLIHLFYSLFILVSKPLIIALKSPIILITHRFYESEKGVLTQIAAVFAGISFLMISITKYMV